MRKEKMYHASNEMIKLDNGEGIGWGELEDILSSMYQLWSNGGALWKELALAVTENDVEGRVDILTRILQNTSPVSRSTPDFTNEELGTLLGEEEEYLFDS